jgi:hypothetical protein
MKPVDRTKSPEGDEGSRLKYPRHPVETTQTSKIATPWELYIDKATISDQNMIKQWDSDLSTLLIFVGIY